MRRRLVCGSFPMEASAGCLRPSVIGNPSRWKEDGYPVKASWNG
jgi:hypothetical protein